MARVPETEIERLKSEVSVERLVEASGIELKKAGKDVTREKLVSTLEGLQNFDLGGFKINYSANSRQGSRYVELTVVGAGGKVIK